MDLSNLRSLTAIHDRAEIRELDAPLAQIDRRGYAKSMISLLLSGLLFAPCAAAEDGQWTLAREFEFDPTQLAEQFRAESEPLDWRQAAPTQRERVVFFGEFHSVGSIRRELAQGLTALRAAGATDLALEGFPEAMQADLSRCASEQGAMARVRSRARIFGVHAQGYIDLILAAHAAGLGVVAIDVPVGTAERGRRREIFMADRLADALAADSRRRIAALVGRNHALDGALPSLMSDRGYESRAYGFLSSGVEPGMKGLYATRELRVAIPGDYRAVLALRAARLLDRPRILPPQGPYTATLSFPEVLEEPLSRGPYAAPPGQSEYTDY